MIGQSQSTQHGDEEPKPTDQAGLGLPLRGFDEGEEAQSRSLPANQDLKGLARGAVPNGYRDRSDRT